MPRSTLYGRIEKHPGIRKAGDLTRQEIEDVLIRTRGDVGQAVQILEVSPRGLRLRMRALDIGTLTSRDSNIHGLRALEFTQMLDVFTPPYNDDRSERSRWFERATTPLPGRDEVFAAWER